MAPPPPLDLDASALFLDFDGTLVEIAPHPDAVIVPGGLAAHLTRLQARMGSALAVVSGRSLPDLERFLQGFDGLLIGSHGAEARGMPAPMRHAPEGVEAVRAQLAEYAAANALVFEPKTHGGALHFRQRPEVGDTVGDFMHQLAEDTPGFAVQPAKMAFELRPAGVSKDRALELLAGLPGFAGRRPVYLGDDATDEPALEWAAARGGHGIKVGEGESAARYRLPDPAAVLAWLGMEAEV